MESLNWKNAQDISLFAAHWSCEKPRAVIALVHGQGEHIGRYGHLADWFNRHRIAVLGFDQQGHGRSAGKRGHASGLDAMLDDIGQLLEETRSRYPGIPVFLYGHSMGGGLVLNYLTRRSPNVAGVVATAPWIRLAFEAPAFKVLAGYLLKWFAPTITLPTELAVHFISRDEAVVRAYQNDPLVHGQISGPAGIAILEAGKWLDKWEGKLDVPLLLQHGSGDKITSSTATGRFAKRVSGDVTFKEWPGLYHEIHNEKEQGEVFEYTLKWMEDVLLRNT